MKTRQGDVTYMLYALCCIYNHKNTVLPAH